MCFSCLCGNTPTMEVCTQETVALGGLDIISRVWEYFVFINRGHGLKKDNCSEINVKHFIYQICHSLLNDSIGNDKTMPVKNVIIVIDDLNQYLFVLTNDLTIVVPCQTYSSVGSRCARKDKNNRD